MPKIVYNIFGDDISDITHNNQGDRIGKRVRDIREAKKISRAQLGTMVGLSADRIQKIENGIRVPKEETLKQIAHALNVSPLALMDPVVDNDIGVMYALFEMSNLHKLELIDNNNEILLRFGDGHSGTLNSFIREWNEVKKKCLSSDNNAEYLEWIHSFPSKLE